MLAFDANDLFITGLGGNHVAIHHAAVDVNL